MGVYTRLLRLMKADAHALLDHLEDPESALRQAVREMEESIAARESEGVRLMRREEECARAAAACRELIEEHRRQFDLCLDSGNESLGKSILRRRLEAEERAGELHREQKRLSSSRETCLQSLTADRERLAAVVEKMRLFAPQASRTDHADGLTGVTDEQVEVAFLQELQRRAVADEAL